MIFLIISVCLSLACAFQLVFFFIKVHLFDDVLNGLVVVLMGPPDLIDDIGDHIDRLADGVLVFDIDQTDLIVLNDQHQQ